jgi:anti-anti-sigma factor
MWQRLSLRTQILLGYGAGLLIMAGMVALLLIHLEQINRAMVGLNTSTSAEAAVGVRLAGQAALAQQAVNRYLQQPQNNNRMLANQSLEALTSAIAEQRPRLTSAMQQAQAQDLANQLARYDDTFHDLDVLLNAQVERRFEVSRHITQADSLTTRFIYGELANSAPANLKTLISTQNNLQSAAITASRMVAEQNPQLADLALASLKLAQTRLKGLVIDTNSDITLRNALDSVTQAISSTGQLATNLAALEQTRTTQLVERSGALQQSADAIAEGALATLTAATTDLQRQMRTTEQVAVAALLAALIVTIGMGIQLARALTRPLDDLVAATERINEGDYERLVGARAGGEVGRLIDAFNQMTATLRQQRAEVGRQQAAMAERHCELEQALRQLREAAEERASLVSTVHALSVPVIPILEHVIVVPLVGELDAERAHLLLQRLLDGVVAQRARLAILDITGVALIDAEGADWLLRAASAAGLVGARTVLAGTSPEVAQALVASGADLSHLHTSMDLRAAVEYALRAAPAPRRRAA